MNISYNTYRNHSAKYLDILKYYCDFERVYGGVNITEVYISTYDKKLNLKDQQLYLDEIKRCVKEQDGLATLSGMSRRFIQEHKVESCKEKALSRRMSKAGESLFGKTKDLCSKGPEGSREYVWAIKVNDYDEYRSMTEEEEKLFNDIIASYYMTEPEKVKKRALLDEKYRHSEDMSKEDYFTEVEKLGLNLFNECIGFFATQTGEIVTRCTKHELYQSMEFEEESAE